MSPQETRASARMAWRLAVLLLSVSPFAGADEGSGLELPLQEAADLASQDQPAILSVQALQRAAMERSIATSQLPDPQLVVGIADVPIDSGDAYSLSRDSDTQVQIGVMQEFPRAAKLAARRLVAEREAQRLGAQGGLTRLEVRRSAAMAWAELWRYTREAALTQASMDDAEAQLKAAEISLRTGSATQAEYLAARQEVNRLRDAVQAAKQGAAHSRNILTRWIGEAADRPMPERSPWLPPAPPLSGLLERLSAHPRLQGAAAEVLESQASEQLAQAAYRPDWRAELGYGHRLAYSDMVTLQVGFDLPVFRGKRQDRELAAALANTQAAEKSREDALRELRSEASLNHHDYLRLNERLREYDATLVPDSEARIQAAAAGWRSGRNLMREVLDARRAALEVQMARLDLQVDMLMHYIQLNYLGAFDLHATAPENNHE